MVQGASFLKGFKSLALTHLPQGNLNEILDIIFKEILVFDGWGISCEIAQIWMPLDFIDDKSTLVQVMALCHQATSHYPSQCWPRFVSPYGVARPQWVKLFTLEPEENGCHFAGNLNENDWIFVLILLKFIPNGPIDNKSSLVQIMAWCQKGVMPLLESVMTMVSWIRIRCMPYIGSLYSEDAVNCLFLFRLYLGWIIATVSFNFVWYRECLFLRDWKVWHVSMDP